MKALLIIFVLLPLTLNAQFEKEEKKLRLAIAAYADAINNKDYAAQVEFIPLALMDTLTKEEVVDEMVKLEDHPFMPVVEVSKEYDLDTLIKKEKNYHAAIFLTMISISDLSSFREQEGAKEAMKNAVDAERQKYGPDNVSFNEESWILMTTMKNKVYAIKEKKSEWKFLNYNPQSAFLIPEEIR